MALSVLWTDTAKSQLNAIYAYYSEHASVVIADKLIVRIIERTDQLIKNPESGPKEPLLINRHFDYRYLVIGNYKIIYWAEGQYIKIASVFDCRQNPQKLKKIK